MHLVGDDVRLHPRVVHPHGRAAEVLGLRPQELERRGLAHVVYVLLVGEAVDADAGRVGDPALRHGLVGAAQHVLGHGEVGLERQPDEVRGLGVVAHEEPGVHRDAVAADAGPRLQDVDPGVLVGDADDLIDVHAAHAADLGELVGEGDVDGAEGVLHDLGHLGGADVGDGDLAPAERRVEVGDPLPDLRVVRAYRAVVVDELVDHVAGDDALRGVHERDVLPPRLLEQRPHEAVDRVRGDRGLDHECGTLGGDPQDRPACGHDVAGVDFLVHLVVGGGDGHDVGAAHLVLGSEADARRGGLGEQLVEPLLLEGGVPGVEGGDQVGVVVRAHDLHAVRGHHEGGGQADVAESDDVNH